MVGTDREHHPGAISCRSEAQAWARDVRRGCPQSDLADALPGQAAPPTRETIACMVVGITNHRAAGQHACGEHQRGAGGKAPPRGVNVDRFEHVQFLIIRMPAEVRGSGVLTRRERGGMGPGIGAGGRLRPGGRGRAQGVEARWWVPGGPGPVLELPTRMLTSCLLPGGVSQMIHVSCLPVE